jgi:hypothetical protein
LLSYAATSPIQSDPAAQESLLATLDIPLKGLDRSAICLLIRARYARQATREQRRSILEGLTQLAARLRDAPADNLQNQMRGCLVNLARYLQGPDWPPELSKALAQMILKDIIERPGDVSRYFPFTLHVTGSLPPYGSSYVAEIREQMQPYLASWVEVASQYLEEHRDAPADAGVFSVVSSLEMVLRVYSEGDNWPVEKTAALLTNLLRALYYTDPADKAAGEPADTRLVPGPTVLLTQIARITGRIPECVRTGHPSSESTIERLTKLEKCLNSPAEFPKLFDDENTLPNLFGEAPYETTRLCVAENKLPAAVMGNRSARLTSPASVLYTIFMRMSPQNHPRAASTDPLLVLVILAELTGEREAEDARIATLFNDGMDSAKVFRKRVEELLASSLNVRGIALRSLEKMAANSKNNELTEAVRRLIPERK